MHSSMHVGLSPIDRLVSALFRRIRDSAPPRYILAIFLHIHIADSSDDNIRI